MIIVLHALHLIFVNLMGQINAFAKKDIEIKKIQLLARFAINLGCFNTACNLNLSLTCIFGSMFNCSTCDLSVRKFISGECPCISGYYEW